jgi:RNA polymerase sigma-70 factor (ECF subfamily)
MKDTSQTSVSMNRQHRRFEDVYLAYHDAIENYLARLVSPLQAADLTQEVFTKVARGLHGFEGRAKISTWIFRIATNTALDYLRSLKPDDEHHRTDASCIETDSSDEAPDLPVSENPLQCMIDMQMNACIREHVDKLPRIYRTVMVLSAFNELKTNDIAEILGISAQTVKIRLHRGRSMLKKILQQACRFYHNPATGALACDRRQSGPVR